MAKRGKKRQSLEEILQSVSDTLFPDKLGKAVVTVGSTDVMGDTPLHVLALRGNDYGIRLLIEAGADVNAVGDMGETPLHVAVRQGSAKAVEALLEAGGDPNIVSEFNQSPRQMAESAGREIAKLFSVR